MNSDTLINKIKRLFSSPVVLNRGYQENVLDEYQNAWDVSLPIDNKNLRSCEQKLIKLDKKELEYLLKQHFSNHFDYCEVSYIAKHFFSLNCECNCFGIEEIHVYLICVLLHLIPVFCIPGQDDKIILVQVILNELLQMLAEGEIYHVFERYLSQQLKVKSSLTEIDLLAGKIHPHNEFLLKLCYLNILGAKNNNQGFVEFLKKNADILVSNIEEMVNLGSSLQRCTWKICEIHFVIPISYNILLCLLNWREHTVKMLKQYKDHIKELLISLLAIMLTKLSTSQINEAFYLCNAIPCVSTTTIQLELAMAFLDISLNPNISQHRKSIIEDKIQQLLIFHDFSKTVLPPITDITGYACQKLDHKRMINICINIVKTKGKDINISMYEGLFCSEKKAIENEVEMVKRSQETETLVLLMLLLITITSTGHHKSAKLKKYLTLKYEYATASLYLLWCSGDIEVHPGPSLNKKTLAHDSTIERRWIQNISHKIIKRLPDQQSKYKPTKKVRNDSANREHFKTLLKTCQEEQVHVPKMYLGEINAWETMEYQLLNKLFVYRREVETIITSLQDFFICGGSTNDLTDIKISFHTELLTNEIAIVLGKDQWPKDQSQLMAYITRHIAGILIKCAHGKDTDAKCDGLWDLPLKNWPKQIILFDPNNRGKYSEKKTGKKLISDQELVDNLITLPQVTIPQKYTKILDAYKLMRKSKTKQNKAELFSIFKRTTSLEKLDYALKNLSENGILTKEIHDILTKWWTTRAVESEYDKTQSLEHMDDGKKKERQHISLNVSSKCMTLAVEPTSKSSSKVSYDFPFKDELVPLKTIKLQPISCQNPAENQTESTTISQETMYISNSIITFDPNSQAIFESEIKLQCKTSTQELDSKLMTHLNQTTSSSFQFSQSNQNIAISGQPGPILCTHNQSTTNSDDLGHLHLSATKDSKNLAFQNLVSPTSDMDSTNSISSVNSESENEERDQNNTLNEGQDLLTDSDYSSDSSNNCVSKTSLKKRKCIEEDRIEMKKRKIPSLKEDKKQSETTSHRKNDSSMELLLDYLDIDLNSFDVDEKTFDVELNALDNDDKNSQISDKDGNLISSEMLMSNKNTNIGANETNVGTELERFLHEMIYGKDEQMLRMKSYLPDV